MSKYRSLVAGAFVFCIFNHQTYGCPICVDAIGAIKKPFFYQEDEEVKALAKNKKQISLTAKQSLRSGEAL
jgi:hypothetical protein